MDIGEEIVSLSDSETLKNMHGHILSNASKQRDTSKWFGYKFVGDNIDKNVKPSLQRHDYRGLSLHCFHGYAVRDRVDLSSLSDVPPSITNPDPQVFIPSHADVIALKEEFCILVSRYAFYTSRQCLL